MKELSLLNCRLDGRYDIREQLGRGSYAEIYLARDIVAAPGGIHREVVIKALNVFLQDDLDNDLERTLVENFQNEAIALDRVRHPNVLNRLGHGTARDLNGRIFHYLVLEYLAGGDLQKAVREKSLDAARVFGYLEQVCAGLVHAHQAGVIHRDIKPQNLLLTADAKFVKIADFGVARFVQSDSPITRVGTNIYAPPEHSPLTNTDGLHMEVTELTPSADIYSLAKTTYSLLTGESPRFFANRQITEMPLSARDEPWSSTALEVLRKATAAKPAERHQSIFEFWQDFSRLRPFLLNSASAKLHDQIGGDAATMIASRDTTRLPQAQVPLGYTPNAPQKPKFNTSRELNLPGSQVLRNPAIAPKPARVEVDMRTLPAAGPLVSAKNATEEAAATAISGNSEVRAEPQTDRAADNPGFIINPPPFDHGRPKRRRRLIAGIATIALFGGSLFAVHYFARGVVSVPVVSWPFNVQTGVTTTDVNLRASGSPDGQKVGLVPRNSKVRIVNSKDNWYEVHVLEFGGPKEKPTDAERGWINGKYLNVND